VGGLRAPDAPPAVVARHNIDVAASPIDLNPLRKALGWLAEALMLWHAQPEGSVLKPHLCSPVIQSFEFSYELSLRNLLRVL
jgi:hypothetical protein